MNNPRLRTGYLSTLDEIAGLRRQCASIEELDTYRAEPMYVDLNECFLFHGATPEIVAKICKGGFDPRRGGEGKGKMFGIATYLTPVASKADIYTEEFTKRLNRTARRQIIVARAALGKPRRATQATPTATRPPDDPDDPDGHPFDSVLAVGGTSVDHTEIMLFQKNQALPLCIVTYSHESACACAECGKRPSSRKRPAPP